MTTLQYFALDSEDVGYAAAIAKLATDSSAYLGYTASQTVRDTTVDSTIKIVTAYIEEEDLTGDTAQLHRDNYPNALCRHRFIDYESFKVYGFHMLGESERSTEAVASRSMVHVARVGTGAADGSTRHDAISMSSVSFSNSTTYVLHGVVWRSSNGMTNGASVKNFATGGAATDAESINLRADDSLTPGIMLPGQETFTGTRFTDDLPWTSVSTLIGANCWVKGNMWDPSQTTAGVVSGTGTLLDTGQADPFKNATDLGEDIPLIRVSSMTEVADAEQTFYSVQAADKTSSPYGAPSAAIQSDGGVFTDLTAEATDVDDNDTPLFPAVPATEDAFYLGHSSIWSMVHFDLGTVGAGTYVLAKEYWNGSTWATIPNITYDGNNGGDTLRSSFGNGGLQLTGPFICFNPPNDWAQTTINSQGPYYYIRVRYVSGTMTTVPVADDILIGFNGAVVRLKDDGDPNNTVIVPKAPSWTFDYRQATRVGQVQFINFNVYGSDMTFEHLLGAGVQATILRFKGGRYVEIDNMFHHGEHDEWFIGAAEDRTPPWDTSDRPNKDNNTGIQRLITRWGTDANEFTSAEVAKFFHAKWLRIGPHTSHTAGSGGDVPGTPLYWPMDGMILENVGYDHKNITRTDDVDKHGIAIRGSCVLTTPSVWRRCLLINGYAHIHPYVTSDTESHSPISANVGSIGPIILEDSVIQGVGEATNNAGVFGIACGGELGRLQDNGGGVFSFGLRRVACVNINQADADGTGFSWGWSTQPSMVEGLSLIGCYRGMSSGGTGTVERYYVVVEDNGTSFTDQTTANNAGTPFTAFPATPAVNDAVYFGMTSRSFRQVRPNLTTKGVGSGLAGVWEYATAEDTWAAIPTTGTYSDLTTSFTANTGDRELTFNRQLDWVKTNKNDALPVEAYWIRFRITAGTYTTVPQITSTDGAEQGAYIIVDQADKIEFLDIVGPWLYISGLNAAYGDDTRCFVLDRCTGRLLTGETIATKTFVWRNTSGADTKTTLASVLGGTYDKAFETTDVWEDNVGRLFANVSTTPGVDIEEVA